MLRALPNILFILIVFILATAFPLSLDILSIDLSQKIVDNPVETVELEPTASITLYSERSTISEKTIKFEMKSDTNQFPVDYLEGYKLEIYKAGQLISTHALSEFESKVTSVSANERLLELDKTELVKEYGDGYYTLKVYDNEQLISDDLYIASLTSTKSLLDGTNQVSSGQLGVTFYYPTSDYANLVPVSRILPLPSNRWRSVYTELVNGPKASLGLYSGETAYPYAPNIRISSGVASIYMYSINLKGFEGHFDMIAEGITKTFMTLGPLDGVKLYVDDSANKTIDGLNINTKFTQKQPSSAYMGFSSDDQYFILAPITLTKSVLADQIEEIISVLKGHTNPSTGYIETLPEEVELKGYTLNGTQLDINFNAELATVLAEYPNYESLMFHSLVQSLSSLDGVTTIVIKANDQPIVTDEFDFNTPVTAEKFINLEP